MVYIYFRETDIRTAGRSLLRNTKVHYHVHKIPPVIRILSEMNQFHILRLYSITIHFNIIPQSKSSCSKWSLPFRFSG